MAQKVSVPKLNRVTYWSGLLLVIALLVSITFSYYTETFHHPALTSFRNVLGLERHALERILYLDPIILAALLFGWKGGVLTTIVAGLLMLPRDFVISAYPGDSLFETIAILVIGGLVTFSFELLRKERRRSRELEIVQRQLQSQINIIKENEKRLYTLNKISNIVSESLELNEILNNAIDSVVEVIGGDNALVYILNKESSELQLAVHRGVSGEYASGVDKIRRGEGFNGSVADTGKTLYVEDASQDMRLTRMVVKQENIGSIIIVPLKSKGEVVGTMDVGVRFHRRFLQDEVELLEAIGNQIGVAIEKARLYQYQREVAERLRTSEKRYRDLFENAHDAIWLHDLEDNVSAANIACMKLTGYNLEELSGLKADSLFYEDDLATIKKIEQALLAREDSGAIVEAKLVKKDGSEAFVQLATNLIFNNEQPTAIQHIARDVTVEKRMRDNLHFYLQQATRAQEDERQRIARELHDDTIQALVVLSRQLDELATSGKNLSQPQLLYLEKLIDDTNNIMQGVRRLSRDLRPAILDRLGLLPALESMAVDMGKYSGISVQVKLVGTERRLPPEEELVLFRIAQEALRNTWKHSRATTAEVLLMFNENSINMNITDNGKGFEVPKSVGELARSGKLGLTGMQERARLIGGSLDLISQTGKGTTITVIVPHTTSQ